MKVKKKNQGRKILLALAIAWTILIFIGCSLPGKDLPPINVFDHFDKVVHLGFFIVFAFLWLAAGFSSRDKDWVLIIALSFIYGFVLEYYQINFVPGRSWDVWDGVADGVGGIIGCLVFSKLNHTWKCGN